MNINFLRNFNYFNEFNIIFIDYLLHLILSHLIYSKFFNDCKYILSCNDPFESIDVFDKFNFLNFID